MTATLPGRENMQKIIIFFLLASPLFLFGGEKVIARIEADAGAFDRRDTPLSAPLDGIVVRIADGQLKLYETTNGARIETPCQLQDDFAPRLFWILDGETKAGAVRRYELVLTDSFHIETPIKIVRDERTLIVQKNGVNVLQYNSAAVYPPDGVADIYKRSAFIHPLWSPRGNVLTRIQPPDHYHHYGLWGPWTKTVIDGREVDFWNLGKGRGTVRFAGLQAIVEGAVFSEFKAMQEHVDFGARGADKTALAELLHVRIWNIDAGFWLLDYTTRLNCAVDSLLLHAYRYGGGIGFRAVDSWSNENVRVLTSEGKRRKDADGTKARWCDVSGGNSAGERSGIVFMSHPSNREHPEPMRVWPESANEGRGDMFFEFCPIRHKSWMLRAGRDYALRYRLLIYDGEVDAQAAERAWRDFAHPPQVRVVALQK